MSKARLELGKSGEIAAAKLLRKNGYKILKTNYRTKLGEIDIIAKDKDTLCVVEVKTRSNDNFGLPQESVSGFKQRQLAKAALSFLKSENLLDRKARFDVVSVIYAEDILKAELIKNAFELSESFTY